MPDELCFIDKTSVDEHTSFRRHGRAKKSKRASMRGVFMRGRRLIAVAAMSIDGVIAGHIIEGSLRWKSYLHFLEHSVVSSYIHTKVYLSSSSSFLSVRHILAKTVFLSWIMLAFIMGRKSVSWQRDLVCHQFYVTGLIISRFHRCSN